MDVKDLKERVSPILMASVFGFACLLVLSFVVATQAPHIQTIATQQVPLLHICSSYGSYPMMASPSTSELCKRDEFGNESNNIVWSATMTSNTNMVVAYWGSNSISGGWPQYFTNSLISPESQVVVCAPNKVHMYAVQCLFLEYGASSKMNGEYAVYTEINGYQIPISVGPGLP